MSIKTWIENDKVFYQVVAEKKSCVVKGVRSTKRLRGILEGVTAEQAQIAIPEDAMRKLRKMELKLYAQVELVVSKQEGAGITWKNLIDRWENEVLCDRELLAFIGLHPRTADGYLRTLLDHTDGWFNRPASDVTSVDFEVLIMQMKKIGYSLGTIYNVKTAVNSCYKWGIKKRLIPNVTVSPTYGCTISRKNARRPEILNFTEICKLLDEAKKRNHEWYPIWKLVLYTGLRSGEAYALKAKDIEFEEKRIILDTKFNFRTKKEEQLKDCEWRQVPINEELMNFLIELGVKEMPSNDYILPKLRSWRQGEAAKILRQFCEDIGINSICFHTLRACWATQLLRNGVAQSKVLIMGGWADLETMQVYLRRAGVEIIGATDSLQFERKERPGRIFKLLANNGNNDLSYEEEEIFD